MQRKLRYRHLDRRGDAGCERSGQLRTRSRRKRDIDHNSIIAEQWSPSRRGRVRHEQLDDWHRDLGSTYRQGECESVARLTIDPGVLLSIFDRLTA